MAVSRSRRTVAVGALSVIVAGSVALFGGQAHADKSGVFTNGSGLAASGYDVVSYFTDSRPVEGSDSHTATYEGATWRFSSAENRDRFAADPARYAPQYGGYCAWAVSQGYTASTVPEAWRIVDDKLYLNYSKGVQRRWEGDIPGNIQAANGNWPRVLN